MAAQTLARFRDNRSDALTVMTNGGGAGVMAADAAARAGVTLHELGATLLERLDAALPPTWSHANPIDIIGDAPVERYVATLQALLDDPRRRRGALHPRADRDRAAAPTSRTPACRLRPVRATA